MVIPEDLEIPLNVSSDDFIKGLKIVIKLCNLLESTNMQIVVVILAYNEEIAIGSVVLRTKMARQIKRLRL